MHIKVVECYLHHFMSIVTSKFLDIHITTSDVAQVDTRIAAPHRNTVL
jgi:hypothetical protein